MKAIVFGLGALALAGCSMSLPVTGEIGGERAQGQAAASFSGTGTFYVLTTAGLRCDGTYDALSMEATITAPVTCSDGRTGNLIITRAPDRVSGTVIGRLSDGTEASFVFGNLSFGQDASGATSQTNPVN